MAKKKKNPKKPNVEAIRAKVEAELADMSVEEVRAQALEDLGLELHEGISKPEAVFAVFEEVAKRAESEATGPGPESDEIWVVSSKPRSFRRAGLAFSREPQSIDPAKLSADARKLIEFEPRLNVVKTTPEGN